MRAIDANLDGAKFTMPPIEVAGSTIAVLNDTRRNRIQITQLSGGGRPLHAAEQHDHIRVDGARKNNLKIASAGLPPGRLRVANGAAGSGKGSLIHGSMSMEDGLARSLDLARGPFVGAGSKGRLPFLARPR